MTASKTKALRLARAAEREYEEFRRVIRYGGIKTPVNGKEAKMR